MASNTEDNATNVTSATDVTSATNKTSKKRTSICKRSKQKNRYFLPLESDSYRKRSNLYTKRCGNIHYWNCNKHCRYAHSEEKLRCYFWPNCDNNSTYHCERYFHGSVKDYENKYLKEREYMLVKNYYTENKKKCEIINKYCDDIKRYKNIIHDTDREKYKLKEKINELKTQLSQQGIFYAEQERRYIKKINDLDSELCIIKRQIMSRRDHILYDQYYRSDQRIVVPPPHISYVPSDRKRRRDDDIPSDRKRQRGYDDHLYY